MGVNQLREAALFKHFSRELTELEVEGRRCVLDLSPTDACLLIGELQAALLRPGNVGPGARLARRVIERCVEQLGHPQAINELVRRNRVPINHAPAQP